MINEEQYAEQSSKRRLVIIRYSVGTICLFIFLFFYVASAEFLQGLGDPTSKYYFNKPYFERYVVASGYSALLILFLFIQLYCWFRTNKSERPPLYKCIMGKDEIYIFKVSFFYAFLYVAIGWLWYLSLVHTSVSENTIIYDCSFILTFLFSIFLLKERVSLLKIVSIVVCVLGVVIVVTSSQSSSSEAGIESTFGGYVELFLSIFFFASFQVLFKKLARNSDENKTEEEQQASQFKIDYIAFFKENTFTLGILGLWVFVCYWPGIFILNFLGIEMYEWPDKDVWEILLLTIFLDTGLNFFLLAGVLFTSPVYIGVGTLLSIPISVVFDYVLHSYILPAFAFVGIFLIVVGFLMINFGDWLIQRKVTQVKRYLEERDEKLHVNTILPKENFVLWFLAISIGFKENYISPQTPEINN